MSVRTSQKRIAVVQPNGKVTREALTVFDQPREPVEVKHDLELLCKLMHANVQGRAAIQVAGNNPALTSNNARLLSNRKLDGNRALIEMMKAVAWHERLGGRRCVSLVPSL